MNLTYKSVDFELSRLSSIIEGGPHPILREKDRPPQNKRDSTTRWPLN